MEAEGRAEEEQDDDDVEDATGGRGLLGAEQAPLPAEQPGVIGEASSVMVEEQQAGPEQQHLEEDGAILPPSLPSATFQRDADAPSTTTTDAPTRRGSEAFGEAMTRSAAPVADLGDEEDDVVEALATQAAAMVMTGLARTAGGMSMGLLADVLGLTQDEGEEEEAAAGAAGRCVGCQGLREDGRVGQRA